MDSVPNFFGGNDGSDGGFTLNRVDGVSTGTNGEVILSEIKCGLLRRDGTTMRADVRKGTLRIIQAALDDTLKQIQWGPREANTGFEAEEDFIILPDEAVLKTMKQPGMLRPELSRGTRSRHVLLVPRAERRGQGGDVDEVQPAHKYQRHGSARARRGEIERRGNDGRRTE